MYNKWEITLNCIDLCFSDYIGSLLSERSPWDHEAAQNHYHGYQQYYSVGHLRGSTVIHSERLSTWTGNREVIWELSWVFVLLPSFRLDDVFLLPIKFLKYMQEYFIGIFLNSF